MENLLFSNLVYRIIGEPEKWQLSSSDKIITFLEQNDTIDVPENRQELAMGHKIIERIKHHNDALIAFRTFLEESRYGLIILDEDFIHIFHNEKAKSSVKSLFCPNNPDKLNQSLIEQILNNPENDGSGKNKLQPIKHNEHNSIYFKVTTNQLENDEEKTFYSLFLPVTNNKQVELHAELRSKYQLTSKEESVLINLIEGKSIQQIADRSFLSRNTIKSQLKSIFSKTNTKSQPSLILLFLNHEVQLLESYFDFKMPLRAVDIDDKFAVLYSQQRLCYRDYGPKDGRPIVVLHNNNGCRFNIPQDYHQHCEKAGRRLIIPDRPGYGKSPAIEGYPENWNTILKQFIDVLELDQFDLLGNILGTSMAINYAATGDARLQKLILTSPVFVNQQSHVNYLSEILYPAARLIDGSQDIAVEIYQLWLKSMSLNIEQNIRDILSVSLGENEKHLLDSPGFIQTMIRNFTEAQAQSIEGSTQDMLFSLSPLNLDLTTLDTPMEFWIGTEDNMISVDGFKDIVAPIPNKIVHVKQGYGRDIYYSLFANIIA